MMDSLILKSSSKQDTVELGKRIASTLRPGDVILLSGDLGAGKTTLVGGVAKGLGIDEPVLSPTFNIMKCYFHSPLSLYHIDAYRLEDAKENRDIGLWDFLTDEEGVTYIEWPEYVMSDLKGVGTMLQVELSICPDGSRKARISCVRE